jgi:hypothetical protein
LLIAALAADRTKREHRALAARVVHAVDQAAAGHVEGAQDDASPLRARARSAIWL